MNSCVEFDGYRDSQGYGHRMVNRERWLAHRLAWTQANGPIPDGLIVRHRCDNPPCINPEHLLLGTRADNSADMVSRNRGSNQNGGKTHCKWGHEFTPENTYTRPDGKRACRACQRRTSAKYSASKKSPLRGTRQS